MGTIEFHGWGSRVEKVEHPDRLVFDLDPDVGLDFGRVKEAAVRMRELLADLGLVTFPLLTAARAYSRRPLDARQTAAVRASPGGCRAPSETEHEISRQHPQCAAQGRIFIDWCQPARRNPGRLTPARPRRRTLRRRVAWESSNDKTATITIRERRADRAASSKCWPDGPAQAGLPKSSGSTLTPRPLSRGPAAHSPR